jgi:pimeloyl-ACP methyl ester carboxylesterase
MHRRVLIAVVLAVLAGAAPANALTIAGAEPERALVCGAHRDALTAPAGERLTLRTGRRGRHALDVARCVDGRWRPVGRARRADGAVRLGPLGPGDLRLSVRRRGSRRVVERRYLRTVERVVSEPVEFRVQNVNRSALPCSSDGRSYTLRGRLVSPGRHRPSAVTLYLHEFGFGSSFWQLDAPGHDHARAMAEAGHASVVIDRLGYAPSDRPAGDATCLGAHADMANQVVAELRRRFTRVTLAGHSVGGGVAELAAISFGGIDGLALFGWADQGYSQTALGASIAQGMRCQTGGDEPGYAFYARSREDFQRVNFFDAEPAVIERAFARRAPDPCGDNASLAQISAVNASRADQIAVPVLLVFGEEDPVFEEGADRTQAQSFKGSPEVRLVRQPRAAHAVALERTAPGMRAELARWLTATTSAGTRAARR